VGACGLFKGAGDLSKEEGSRNAVLSSWQEQKQRVIGWEGGE